MSHRTHLPLILAATLSLATAAAAQSPTDPRRHLNIPSSPSPAKACKSTPASNPPLDRNGSSRPPKPRSPMHPANLQAPTPRAPSGYPTDGSTVKGEVLQKIPSPDPASIPWLLLKAASPTGSGTHVPRRIHPPLRHPRRHRPHHRLRRPAPQRRLSRPLHRNLHLLLREALNRARRTPVRRRHNRLLRCRTRQARHRRPILEHLIAVDIEVRQNRIPK